MCIRDRIIAVLDKGNTYRRNLWQGYKQKRREKARDEAVEQETKELQQQVQDLLVYLGVKIMWVPGEEADDAIALLCQKLAGPKIVYTVDADLLALVNENTQVLRAGKLYEMCIRDRLGAGPVLPTLATGGGGRCLRPAARRSGTPRVPEKRCSGGSGLLPRARPHLCHH